MGNKARVSRQHYTTAGYRPPPNESPCPGTPNLQRDRASPSRRPSSCGIHCFPGTDGGPWRVRPHLLKSRNQPFDFNGRFCQASGSLKRLRCAGVSTFGSSKAAANAARSPRYQPSSSWQTRRTIVSGRPPWAHNACKLRFTATQSAPSLSRRTTKWSPGMRQAASFRAMLRSRSLLPSCGMHKTADHPPIPGIDAAANHPARPALKVLQARRQYDPASAHVLVESLEQPLLPQIAGQISRLEQRSQVFGIAGPRNGGEPLVLAQAIDLVERQRVEEIRRMSRYEDLPATLGIVAEFLGQFGKQFRVELILGSSTASNG